MDSKALYGALFAVGLSVAGAWEGVKQYGRRLEMQESLRYSPIEDEIRNGTWVSHEMALPFADLNEAVEKDAHWSLVSENYAAHVRRAAHRERRFYHSLESGDLKEVQELLHQSADYTKSLSGISGTELKTFIERRHEHIIDRTLDFTDEMLRICEIDPQSQADEILWPPEWQEVCDLRKYALDLSGKTEKDIRDEAMRIERELWKGVGTSGRKK